VSYDYWNPFSQKERREIIANERDCFHSRAQAAVDLESGGRFAKLTPNKVTGAEPISQVPRQPSGPWAHGDPGAPDPVTDQFGDVNEMESTGSHVEIEKSLEKANAELGSSPRAIDVGPAAAALSADHPDDAVSATTGGNVIAISEVLATMFFAKITTDPARPPIRQFQPHHRS
jgi:hypothetical protein